MAKKKNASKPSKAMMMKPMNRMMAKPPKGMPGSSGMGKKK